jgi:hypothetical protein
LILKKFNPSNLVIWSKSSDPVKTLNTNGILRYILIFFLRLTYINNHETLIIFKWTYF